MAFIRAVNVAGHARVSMNDVRDAFEAAGCQNVRSYIQSGNVIFESSARGAEALFRRVGAKLRALLGEEPRILFRTIRDVERLVHECPFASRAEQPRTKLYIAFLARPARNKPAFPLVCQKEGLEAISMRGREVFVVSYPKKNGFFGFPNNFIEKELGVAATSRNWSTVNKIVEFAHRADGRAAG